MPVSAGHAAGHSAAHVTTHPAAEASHGNYAPGHVSPVAAEETHSSKTPVYQPLITTTHAPPSPAPITPIVTNDDDNSVLITAAIVVWVVLLIAVLFWLIDGAFKETPSGR